MDELTHITRDGDLSMVDISSKSITQRKAIAKGSILLGVNTIVLIEKALVKKGDVLAVAKIAGIMSAKKVADIVPLCHPISISHIDIIFELDHKKSRITCTATVNTTGKTGVEIEALCAVQVSLLTIYDMCKAYDKDMVMNNIELIQKSGGTKKPGKKINP